MITVMTQRIKDTFPLFILRFHINRFMNGDYGDIPQEDKRVNQEVLRDKSGMMMGSYSIGGKRVWMTRDLEESQDYDVLTVLFPDEY